MLRDKGAEAVRERSHCSQCTRLCCCHMGTGWAPLCTPSECPLVMQWAMAPGGSCPDTRHAEDESQDCLPPAGCHIPQSLGFPTYEPRPQWVAISQKAEGGEGAGPWLVPLNCLPGLGSLRALGTTSLPAAPWGTLGCTGRRNQPLKSRGLVYTRMGISGIPRGSVSL